jgi:predicted esterase
MGREVTSDTEGEQMKTAWTPCTAALLAALFLGALARGAESDPKVSDLRVGGDKDKRYFLFGPGKGAKAPAAGYGLVVVLPGGEGGADFRPFVGAISTKALPQGYLVAQPVAVQWTAGQEITWPTKKDPAQKMKFTTEEFVEAVIKDVGKKHRLDPKRVFTLSWSSGGPAAYAVSLSPKTAVRGSLVAMSVFLPKKLPPLTNARGHAYYLLHSPEDDVCRVFFARWARNALGQNKARVTLETYDGGHGWHGDYFGQIRKGIRWLEKHSGRKADK